jgi:hypothetical protein
MNQIKTLLPVCEFAVFSMVIYIILELLLGEVFATVLTTIGYVDGYPIQFILMNCITFFLTQVIFSKPLRKNRFQVLRYLYFYLFWTALTCILGGLLGSYYDMETGWYPEGKELWKKIINDMLFEGFSYGLFVIVFSIPYNIIVLIGSFLILKYNNILGRQIKI